MNLEKELRNFKKEIINEQELSAQLRQQAAKKGESQEKVDNKMVSQVHAGEGLDFSGEFGESKTKPGSLAITFIKLGQQKIDGKQFMAKYPNEWALLLKLRATLEKNYFNDFKVSDTKILDFYYKGNNTFAINDDTGKIRKNLKV